MHRERDGHGPIGLYDEGVEAGGKAGGGLEASACEQWAGADSAVGGGAAAEIR